MTQETLELAMAHHRAGRLAEAEAIYRHLLSLNPWNPDLIHLLGMLAHQGGHSQPALELVRQAIAMSPEKPHYFSNLGIILMDLGRFDEAVAAYEESLRLQPDTAETWSNLGIVRVHQQQWEHAIVALREALRRKPDLLKAGLSLAGALDEAGQIDEAIEHLRAMVEQHPTDAWCPYNLGNLLMDQGVLDEGLEMLRRSVALNPTDPLVHSNLILQTYYHPHYDAARIAQEQQAWAQKFAVRAEGKSSHDAHDFSPHRRLRIGWLSADLRHHVVGRALLPAFEAHDRTGFEFICYSTTPSSDAVAERFRAAASHWRDVGALPDEALCTQIRSDEIDILIDLGLHTARNRLPVIARKPAPLQISWLGQPCATGVRAIDYRLSDPFLDPPAPPEEFESPLRLPECWTCYLPPVDAPEPRRFDPDATSGVTFGSFNNFCKINDEVLRCWAGILTRLPGSRLLLLAKPGRHRERTVGTLAGHGVAPEAVSFLEYGASHAYPLRYQQIDIALDPFPYNGMTTTCDALWMGVPVIALIGAMPLGRASYSLLANVGLPELAADSVEGYIETALLLARDRPRLAALHAGLRGRMGQSVLLDGPRMARQVEAAFRTVWQRRCSEAMK